MAVRHGVAAGDEESSGAELIGALVARFAGGETATPPGAHVTDRIAAIEETGGEETDAVDSARELQAALYEAGFGWLSGPVEYGGQGRPAAAETDFDARLLQAGLPSRAPLFVGLHIVAPAVLAHGTPELRARLLPGLFSGRVLGCQLFSEPDAGSDLAAVSTRAVRDGDDWIITGQKVWTSWAQVADIGEALVRTDPNAAKHAGLTMFAIDLHSVGVTVRPLRQATGGAAFNEVFLDEVRVPDANRIGDQGDGWAVANTSLSSERGSMASGEGPLSSMVLERLHALLDREWVARPEAAQQVARSVTAVVAAVESFSRDPGDWEGTLGRSAASIQKLLMVRAVDSIAEVAEALLGARVHLDDGVPDTYAWSEFVLGAPGLHLAGGTDEIQRTLIAQLGLGFPRPPRPTR